MDFLKSAVASAMSGSFPYIFREQIDNGDSIWTLHDATKRVCNTCQTRAANSDRDMICRVMGLSVACLHTISRPTSTHYRWRETGSANSAVCDIRES